jgi:hypothetical protein
MDRPSNLIDDYLDGELSDDTRLRLATWLHERDDNVRELSVASLIHSLLDDFVSQRQVQADALLRAMTSRPTALGAPIAPTGRTSIAAPLQSPGSTPGEIPRTLSKSRFGFRRWPALAAIAALGLITVVGGMTAFVVMRPRVAAMLTQTAGCRWEASDVNIVDGALFHAGDELRLAAGRALITFTSGARIVLEGPARLTINSQSAARLASGAITTTVPSQAVGFSVRLPLGELVDLGTEFTARVQADGSFELQVFNGLVELALIGPDNQVEGGPLRLAEGVAVRIDAQSYKVASIAYNPAAKMNMP